MKGPAHFETERLVLSPPATGDAQTIFDRYASDPEVTRFLGWPRHRSIDDTRAFLAFSAAEWERWPAGPYLIRSRDDGRLLGGTGLAFETPDDAATGYVMSRTESDAMADRIESHFAQHGYGLWAVEIPRVAPFAGFIGLSTPRFDAHFTPCTEIGWRLAVEFWDRGYARSLPDRQGALSVC